MQVKRFLPFLSGNRSCIGMSLAQLNYTTAVATLLANFSFRLSEDVSTLLPALFSLHLPALGAQVVQHFLLHDSGGLDLYALAPAG